MRTNPIPSTMVPENFTKARDASWYDRVYMQHAGVYLGSAYKAPWLPLWVEIAYRLDSDQPDRIVDLGCGCGHLAEVLHVQRARFETYQGLDFSPLAIAVARARLSLADPGRFAFAVADVTDLELWPDADAFVLTEVLEHVRDDLGLLARLPADKHVYATVPKFDDDGHVRYFPQPTDVVRRYTSGTDRAMEDLKVIGTHYVFTLV